MNVRLLLALGSLAPLALSASLVACSGDSTTITTDAGSDGSTSNDSGGNDSATNDSGGNDSGTKDSGTADGGDTQCSGLAKAACQQCCLQAHPNAAILVTETAKCACQTPGLCQTACATTLCAAKNADTACGNCIQSADAGACLSVGIQACAKDTDCTAGLQCANACK